MEAATERDRRMAERLSLLRFVPVVLAAVAFVWVVARLALPIRAVVIVSDQNGAAIEGAEVRLRTHRGPMRTTTTDAGGRAKLWVTRSQFNYSSQLFVELPRLGLTAHEGWWWREARRGEHKRVTLTIGDTVTGVLLSAADGRELDPVVVRATFTLEDGGTRTRSADLVPHQQRGATGGRISVVRPGARRAVAVSVDVWAGGHAPATVTAESRRSARGHPVFDVGEIRLEPWASVVGTAQVQRPGQSGPQSWSSLAKLVVWSPSAVRLAELNAPGQIEETGEDNGMPYVILRGAGQFTTGYNVTVPLPATRVVLVATSYDRPPAVISASADSLRDILPGQKLSGFEHAILPAANPMTVTFRTESGTVVAGVQVEFRRYIADSRVAVPIGVQVYQTDGMGRVTLPILEDGVRYRVGVRPRAGGKFKTFDAVIDARSDIVVPD